LGNNNSETLLEDEQMQIIYNKCGTIKDDKYWTLMQGPETEMTTLQISGS
jgi:hypothetical protein